jgi:hypothetical protein
MATLWKLLYKKKNTALSRSNWFKQQKREALVDGRIDM